ncbi:cytochrome C oxidase subunit IV family protein [Candidatus Poriferisocius sp.]|uniref:cytochrome C oxidase subunit IV family protein n=1 Tax=Candidatus Poriferisocius sp. TaxID=3101276 RepID=UPI003B02D737
MATVTPESPETAHSSDEHAHPSNWLYVKVAIALALLTAFEVFTYFESVHGWGDTTIIIMLVAMMLVKFFLVVAFFMHLKFDSPIFWRLFVFGLILAMAVYMVMLTAFRFW